MTMTAKQVDDIFRRVANLEQQISSIHVIGVIDPEMEQEPINVGGVIIDREVNSPTGVTVTPGAFYDDIYIDVSWTNPDEEDQHTVAMDVELAEKNGAVYSLLQVQRVTGNTYRFSRLRPNKNYAVRINGVNRLGIKTETGSWIDVTTGQDSTVPAAVTGLVVARGATSVVVKFTPSTAIDIDTYEIEVDTVATFNSANYRRTRSSSWVVAFNDVLAQGNWYARVSPFDKSGNQGAPVTAGPVAAGGVIDSMIVAGLDAAKITFGTMDGDRIAANSASIGILETSSLVAADITLAGGSFRAGSPPTTGVLFNSQGLRLYGGGIEKIVLDAFTGNATYRGHIDASTIYGSDISAGTITGALFQTAVSGERLVIQGSIPERIRFYSSSGEIAQIGSWTSTGWKGTYNYLKAKSDNGLTVETMAGNPATLSAGTGDFTGTVYGSYIQAQYSFLMAGSTVIDSSRNGYFTGLSLSTLSSTYQGQVMDSFGRWVGPIQTNNFWASSVFTPGDLSAQGMAYLTGGLTLSSGLVTRGVPDSGGAGFRLLRVPNT